MEWNGKKVKVFMFGDYDFLLKMYGISGAQSYHLCLWCKASKHQTQRKRHDQQPNISKRTLENTKKDHRKYFLAGNKTKPKSYNNMAFYPNLVKKKKNHDLLEQECHELDKLIA